MISRLEARRPSQLDRRAFIGATLGVAALGPAFARQQSQLPPYEPRDWSGDTPLVYPDPDIIALDDRFRRYILFNTPIRRHYVGTLWAEGPAWNGVGRYLVWSDIPNNRQLRWIEDDDRVTEFRSPSGNSNGKHLRPRDASRLAEFLWGPEEEEVAEDAEEVEAPADVKAVAATPGRPRVARRAPRPDPTPAVEVAPAATASIPELPPLPGLFDSGTPGIIPPGTENIRLHVLGPQQVAAEEQGLVEVIVSPYGKVERAKLISAPGDIHEAMILSAIKAWQFTPALKDGHPRFGID